MTRGFRPFKKSNVIRLGTDSFEKEPEWYQNELRMISLIGQIVHPKYGPCRMLTMGAEDKEKILEYSRTLYQDLRELLALHMGVPLSQVIMSKTGEQMTPEDVELFAKYAYNLFSLWRIHPAKPDAPEFSRLWTVLLNDLFSTGLFTEVGTALNGMSQLLVITGMLANGGRGLVRSLVYLEAHPDKYSNEEPFKWGGSDVSELRVKT